MEMEQFGVMWGKHLAAQFWYLSSALAMVKVVFLAPA
jgi:hypothetical protein